MRKITTILLLCLSATLMQAQISIGGSIYGGGNAGNTGGSSKVTVYSGNLHAVFAGARMANVGGSSFVHLDGEHASDYILIDYVYGGNDIAGTIGSSKKLPTELTKVGTTTGLNNIDSTWNAFVRISPIPAVNYTQAEIAAAKEGDDAYGKTTSDTKNKVPIYIGQLFGGGNGYYDYVTSGAGTVVKDKVTGAEVATSTNVLSSPVLGKTYLELLGGSIVYAYGGGNDATITDKTVICLDNSSKVVNSIKDTLVTKDNGGELLTNDRFELMRINTTFSYPSSDEYQIGRLFGGNNKADMAIRPRWNLQEGRVRNLYGGGNEGRMTSPEGLLMQIEGAGMVVDNVYGGCRKADVKPLYNNNDATPVPYNDVALDPEDNPNHIPAGYAARVRVLAGHITTYMVVTISLVTSMPVIP